MSMTAPDDWVCAWYRIEGNRDSSFPTNRTVEIVLELANLDGGEIASDAGGGSAYSNEQRLQTCYRDALFLPGYESGFTVSLYEKISTNRTLLTRVPISRQEIAKFANNRKGTKSPAPPGK
jgi:hypothetical protein